MLVNSAALIVQNGTKPIKSLWPKETSLPCHAITTAKAPTRYKKRKVFDKIFNLIKSFLFINIEIRPIKIIGHTQMDKEWYTKYTIEIE